MSPGAAVPTSQERSARKPGLSNHPDSQSTCHEWPHNSGTKGRGEGCVPGWPISLWLAKHFSDSTVLAAKWGIELRKLGRARVHDYPLRNRTAKPWKCIHIPCQRSCAQDRCESPPFAHWKQNPTIYQIRLWDPDPDID